MGAHTQVDPTAFASGGDDGTVRLWSLRQAGSVACIDTKANVCSVQFSPTNSHLLAFGSANYRTYLYDRRQVLAACLPDRTSPTGAHHACYKGLTNSSRIFENFRGEAAALMLPSFIAWPRGMRITVLWYALALEGLCYAEALSGIVFEGKRLLE